MCGITGKIYFHTGLVNHHDIEEMNQKIIHRGPDDGGVYLSPDQKIGLGHRRLSIIDLSPLGHQPMGYLDRYRIVFNGEIYNFQEKRHMLEKLGYQFRSKTDTEVIMALYDKFDKKCLEHLRGMFAFCIYDEKEKTVFCARDRVGKKPFKYYLDNKVFIFSSELKAILTQQEYRKEPDFTAIHHYLTYGFCPAPLTGFKDIQKLKPAHYLFIDLKTNKVEIEKYWELDYSKKLDLSIEEWKKNILDKLEESIRLRMISDVPLGAFLSGGIDSSAVVGLMSRLSSQPIKTFSIGFEEEKYNELPYAKLVAEKFKTDHTEFIVKPEAISLLPELVRLYEEPFADPSAIPTYYVSQMTRQHVTVALSGDGGDENFAGYYRYFIQKLSWRLELLRPLNKLLALAAAKIPQDKLGNDFIFKAAYFLKQLPLDYRLRYLKYMYRQNDELVSELYSDNFAELTRTADSSAFILNYFKAAKSTDRIDQILYADFSTYLPDDLMAKIDIAGMAVALETRAPFLDHEFLELTAQIPSSLKIKGLNQKKWILKESLRDILPEEILFRPKKGFEMPVQLWLRDQMKAYTNELLLSDRVARRDIFKQTGVKKILATHQNSSIDLSYKIWPLIILENWFREYFD